MLKNIFILFVFVFSLGTFNPIYASTIFDANQVNCSNSINLCDSNFNHVIFGNISINAEHEILFDGNWVRVNYYTHLSAKEINVSTDIKASDGSYEISINTPPNVYNSYYSSRITFVSGIAELWIYRMDPFGNNYSNLIEHPPREDTSLIIGPVESEKYYHFQIIYKENLLKIYFDNKEIFSKDIQFVNNYYNVALMSKSSYPWKNLLITDDPNIPNPINSITPTSAPTPTSTPSPTPTYTPTPTSTPQPKKNPIIIIPGMMSTWNKEAIIHRKLVSQSEWKLTSFVKEYDALINTLKTLDYVENKDYFLFAYDWRKPVNSLTEELNNYIKIHLPNESEFSIIGHSFGGLIARIYQQKYTNDYLKSIVTAGSPLKGAPQAYKAVSAGEIDQDNSIIWLAQKIVLQLYRDRLMSDKQIINENFHSIKDLLPVFNYLRDINGEEIDSSMLTLKNDLLSLYEDRLVDLYPILSTLSGNRIRTIAGYTVSGQNVLDKLLGNYIDGRPTNGYFDEGDGLVLIKSSSIGNNTNLHDFNHGEVIYKKRAIKSILDSLNIPHEDTQIVEGRGTIISPSLIFIIKSPAEMEVKIEDKVYKEKDGIIYVENALDGEYELFVHGKNRGMYEILIGAIGVSSNSWNTINGEITSIIPQLETDRYKISFNSDKPVDYFVDLNKPTKLIDELILYLKQNVNINKKIINELSRLRYYITQKKYKHATKLIILIDKHLVKNREYYALEKLENIYSRIQTEPSKKRTLIDKKFDSIKNDFIKKQSKLLKSKNNRTKLIVLELINKKIKTAEDNIKNVNYSSAEIVLVSISNLMEIL